MAEQIADNLVLNSPALAVEQSSQHVNVITATSRNKARHLIMAVPPVLASRIHYSQPLPSKRAALLQRVPMGSVIKIHVAYESPFWRKRGLKRALLVEFGAVDRQCVATRPPDVAHGLRNT
ncbi:MAG: FAD-dependent oxidoreductase [Marinobacter sp.]